MQKQSVNIEMLTRKGCRRIAVKPGLKLSQVIREASLPLGFSCGGRGVCTACSVWVKGPASQLSEKESHLLAGDEILREGWQRRISCLTYVNASISITTDYW